MDDKDFGRMMIAIVIAATVMVAAGICSSAYKDKLATEQLKHSDNK